MKIVRRTWPLEKEGELNRAKMDLAEATGANGPAPFVAGKTYQPGEVISHSGRVYTANAVIIAGETVTPGGNAMETSIEEIINLLNTKGE
jgi:hypothetical protein